MNKEFLEFIQKHNIDIDSIYDDLQIYSEKEINRIISNNRLDGKTSTELVSIAEIIGYDYDWRGLSNNIARNFSGFFGQQDAYHSRSLGMLEYSSEDIIEKLYQSFKREPIRILELDNGRKIISGNGLHRYTVLRLHYINELNKVRGNKDEEEFLKSKYEIPVELTKVDLLKTYCQYIIRIISGDTIYLSNEYDDNYMRTNRVKVSSEDKTMIMDNETLINYTKNMIRNIPTHMIEWFVNDIRMNCEGYESFNMFINTYFSDEISLLLEKNEKKSKGGQ